MADSDSSEDFEDGVQQLLQTAPIIVDTGYRGPFAVEQKSDTVVTVVCRADDILYFQNSHIISGLTLVSLAVAGNIDVTISGIDGWVCADITFGSTYACAFPYYISLPLQTTTHLFVPLARVLGSAGKITKIIQVQYGNIYPTQWGRAGG